MPKNAKTLVVKMLAEMSNSFEIHENNTLDNYVDFCKVKNSWILHYGKGRIVFQYVPKDQFAPEFGMINVVLFKTDNFDNDLYAFYFEDDDLPALNTDLIAIRQIIEEGVYFGCDVKKVGTAISKYLTKRNKIKFNL